MVIEVFIIDHSQFAAIFCDDGNYDNVSSHYTDGGDSTTCSYTFCQDNSGCHTHANKYIHGDHGNNTFRWNNVV
jgi:hypothetical protein